jgi:aspartate aminotransferase
MLSKRIRALSPSPTLAFDKKAKELKEQGFPVVNLTLGEPDFPTPSHICDAATKAMNEGQTHYTLTSGILPLREEIAAKLKKENEVTYDPSEIVVGVGSKQLLYNAFQVLLNKGDEVLIPTPTWSTYVEQVKLAEGKPILIPLAAPFKLKTADLIPHITTKTKMIVLNSPSNPTGAMIEREELVRIANLAVKHQIYVVSDEIYEKLTWGPRHISIASLNDEIRQYTITINGFSKSYAMTGWRIGYAGGPAEIITAMSNLQSQTTSNTSSISQAGALAALTGTQQPLEIMKNEFAKRRAYVLEELKKIPSFEVTAPEGAFYFYVQLKEGNAEKWCKELLEKEYVAVVPGEAFCAESSFRMSYASSMENLKEGIERIKKFIESK